MLLLIDNYDSFTYNLFHYLGELGGDAVIRRNDEIDVQAAMAMNPSAILLSPGPCDPDQAGICLALIAAAAETRTPLIGVCLGHQAIGQAFGGKVVRAGEIVHGKLGTIHHRRQGRLRRPPLALPRHPLPQPDRRARDACPPPSRSPPSSTTARSWASPTATLPDPRRAVPPRSPSPPSTATRCCKNFLDLARVADA